MASVIVPATFEQKLALSDGSASGCQLELALRFDLNDVANLYSVKDGQFKFSFQEHGTAYGETEASDFLVETTFGVSGGQASGFQLRVDLAPVEVWGINFAGSVAVKHDSGEERLIYLPGTRTYDPAGITGDPHASERIGPSCSRTQAGITIAQLVASANGAELKHINDMQEKLLPLVKRYHGRVALFEWMKVQIEEAVFKNVDVTPYPEFIKTLVRSQVMEISADSQAHTRDYLHSYNSGKPHPPLQYYQKVAKKDKIEELLSGDDLRRFKEIVEK